MAEENVITGKTKDGFEYKIDKRLMNDWRLLSFISLTESSVPTDQIRGASGLVTLLLGDQEQALMEFLKEKNDGFVPVEAVTDVLAEIITATKEVKNL